ncbi:hypothetical protein GGQ86_002890 [Xanthobacter flavus]|uniref:Uncharacterized protein n=1 Tax=Xanthobacter flavus TaxID=281 RepID=A0A9W6CTG9_XANFL|nr:hypothetical protein [Xanthobacter flavus]MDR6334408.1 hypothetical protein [Xanthobacter flavus]GLI23573.1 hypothetical protein XFLAVUS301_32470 [Xanthobacter flavus]
MNDAVAPYLFAALVAVYVFGLANHFAARKLALRLRSIAGEEWRRLGSPECYMVHWRLSSAMWRDQFATQRLIFWAVLTEKHARYRDAELSRWAWIVRVTWILSIGGLVAGAVYFWP